jgi:hypothetical protein
MTVIADSVGSADDLAHRLKLTVVSTLPRVRRDVRRIPGAVAIPRPPGSFWLPPAEVVVCGARPDDLRLAAAPGVERVIVAGDVSPLVLAAYGLAPA